MVDRAHDRSAGEARPRRRWRRDPIATFMLFACALGLALAAVPASATRTTPPDSPVTRHRSVLEGLPGYRVPPNPESLAVRRGRRDAPAISTPFTGGARSFDALGRAFVEGIRRNDERALRELCVTREEFSRILWPEMPQSAPASGATADDAWRLLDHRLTGGVHGALGDNNGRRLRYVGTATLMPPLEFRNYRLIRGVAVAVYDSAMGTTDTLSVIRTVAARKGKWKIYSMKD